VSVGGYGADMDSAAGLVHIARRAGPPSEDQGGRTEPPRAVRLILWDNVMGAEEPNAISARAEHGRYLAETYMVTRCAAPKSDDPPRCRARGNQRRDAWQLPNPPVLTSRHGEYAEGTW